MTRLPRLLQFSGVASRSFVPMPHRQRPRRHRARSGERGFTLIELLVVLSILGLLLGFVAPAMMRQLGSAKHKVAEQSVAWLVGILDLYRLDVGNYPMSDNGLKALSEAPAALIGWEGPYLRDSNGIKDPWRREFQYRNPSSRPGHDFDIVSLGADGQPGGGGEDADVFNP